MQHDDEIESPFGRRRRPDARPNPVQEGPFTYGKLIGTPPNGPYRPRQRLFVVLLLGSVALFITIATIRALLG